MTGQVPFDPYLIPGTNVLRNLAGATTEHQLSVIEHDLVGNRTIAFWENPPSVEGTLAQLRDIHHFLFQDIYEWAGEIRTIDMGKGDGLPFQPLELFDVGARYAERVLSDNHMLCGLSREQFIERLSENYDNFNILHPFREGNGRAQRAFWSLIAGQAGWYINWAGTTQAVNDLASITARNTGDRTLLEEMFASIVEKPSDDPAIALLPHAYAFEDTLSYAYSFNEDVHYRGIPYRTEQGE